MGGIGFFDVLAAAFGKPKLPCMGAVFQSPLLIKCPRSLEIVFCGIAPNFPHDKGQLGEVPLADTLQIIHLAEAPPLIILFGEDA